MPLNLESDYTTKLCFPLLLFLNLKPLENGGINAEKYNKMGAKTAANSDCR